jgi:hypothetical protein
MTSAVVMVMVMAKSPEPVRLTFGFPFDTNPSEGLSKTGGQNSKN